MDRIFQGENKISQTKKTVDWLVAHTKVDVFDPITFEGYQRSIDQKHCDKIVAYLLKDFFLPTSIICASRKKYTDNGELYIVDGQHRVRAFELVRSKDPERYRQIKDNEVSVIILEEVPLAVEIDTFITINKTSKKVDTSLAFVLKNKINYDQASQDISISKREYLSVELATVLNDITQGKNDLWTDKILFEGSPKQSPQLISLNAFVISMRSLLGCLERYRVVHLDWQDRGELNACIGNICSITNAIWYAVRNKWPDLFDFDLDKRRIIQGSIGFSSINKFLIQNLKLEQKNLTKDEFIERTGLWIRSIQIPSTDWLPGGRFSKYSSATGYSIIAQELMKSTGQITD